MGMLDGKVAIVTGAGQGIGKGVAFALAKEGAAVAVADINPETGAQTAQEIKDFGGNALALQFDVSQRSEVDNAVAKIVKKFGTVHILVNNAITAMTGEMSSITVKGTKIDTRRHIGVEQITDQDMHNVIGAGLMGTLYCMQACFPYMKQHGGKIINFGSGAGTMGIEGCGAYAAIKEGIRGLTKVTAGEWGQYGINVNVICPAVRTRAFEAWFETLSPEEQKMQLAMIPMRRAGDAEKDIGRTIVFLAGPDSDYITGRTLHVDGGRAYYDR